MFSSKFKLVGYAVGLVAVLVMLLALPGVTQDNPLARPNIIKMLKSQFAVLTATAGDSILDPESAVLFSDPARLAAYVSVLRDSIPLDKLRRILAGEEEVVTIGGLYVGEDHRGILPLGVYGIKLIGQNKVVLVDKEGNQVYTAHVKRFQQLEQPSFGYQVTINCFDCPNLNGGGGGGKPRGGGTWCFSISVQFLIFEVEYVIWHQS